MRSKGLNRAYVRCGTLYVQRWCGERQRS